MDTRRSPSIRALRLWLAEFLLHLAVVMLILESRDGESLEQYLGRSVVTIRETGSSAELEFGGVSFVISSAMSVQDAITAWRRAQRQHDMLSEPFDYRSRAGRFHAP